MIKFRVHDTPSKRHYNQATIILIQNNKMIIQFAEINYVSENALIAQKVFVVCP